MWSCCERHVKIQINAQIHVQFSRVAGNHRQAAKIFFCFVSQRLFGQREGNLWGYTLAFFCRNSQIYNIEESTDSSLILLAPVFFARWVHAKSHVKKKESIKKHYSRKLLPIFLLQPFSFHNELGCKKCQVSCYCVSVSYSIIMVK